RYNLEPDAGMTEIRDFIDPQTVRTKLKNATVRFLFDQRQRERVAIKRDRLLVSVRRAFQRNVGAAGESRSVEFRHHDVDLRPPLLLVKDAREVFAQPFLLFP